MSTYAIGDIHGDYDRMTLLLQNAGIIQENKWAIGTDTMVFIGDLTDRWDKGIECIEFVMDLQAQASEAGGEVVSLCGNHDILLYAWALNQSESRLNYPAQWCFENNGGQRREMLTVSSSPKIMEWLRNLPMVFKKGDYLFQHADTCDFYTDLLYMTPINKNTSGDAKTLIINQNAANSFTDSEAAMNVFEFMCDNRYFDRHDDAERIMHMDSYLSLMDAKVVVHGHTRFVGNQPLIENDGRSINIDGSLSRGYRRDEDRGFLLRLEC